MTGQGSAPSPREWVERADQDLRTAEHTLNLVYDCPFGTVCFHAQQRAEKYLKALLVSRAIPPPRTHDLTQLFALLPGPDRRSLGTLNLKSLNPYTIEGRYPGDWDPIDREESEGAVSVARQVRDAVRPLLGQP